MNASPQEDLLNLLKTVADENRLTMLGMMSEQECTVTNMAVTLKLSEPTVSHHVGKLQGAGLLTLRMAGNQRFYGINIKRLDKFKAYIAEIETLSKKSEAQLADMAWIEALDWTAEDKKVLRDYTLNQSLTQLPVKEKKWLVVLRWLATKFEANRTYTEKEVNALLTEAHEDYATLRRNLVEYGFMRRERGGSMYWLTPEDESSQA